MSARRKKSELFTHGKSDSDSQVAYTLVAPMIDFVPFWKELRRIVMNYDRFLTAFFACLVVVFIASTIFFMPQGKKLSAQSQATIIVGNSTLEVDVASTDAAREQGLSGRTSLPEGHGMLFVFQQDGLWGFWMKDMNFPIDILWFDSAGHLVTVWPSLSSSTYPQVFYPKSAARYVLEVPAGYAAAHHISMDSQLSLPSGIK